MSPEALKPGYGTRSVLCLLRREIQECLVDEVPQSEDALLRRLLGGTGRPAVRRLFATTMVTLGGIDLLGTFFTGSDAESGVGIRFRDFVDRYLQPTDPLASATLFAVRNALMHSFGLYEKKSGRILELDDDLPSVVLPTTQAVTPAGNTWVVYPVLLYRDFVHAIRRYEQDLAGDATLQGNFERVYKHYGTINIT